MLNLPLVSIIIPTYKRTKLLDRAIYSALNQTYESIEVIIVDDNENESKYRDEVKDIISKYEPSGKITYVQLKENSGGAIARNVGAKLAKGEYINFLDDDDELKNNKIELQVNKFINSDKNLAVVGCFANIIDKDGNLIRVEKVKKRGNVFKDQLAENTCTTSIALLRKEIFDQCGGFEKVPSSQEHLLLIKIFNINPYYDYVEEVLVNIYHHEGERISTNKNKPLGAIRLFEYVSGFFYRLDKNDINYIKSKHYENIIRSYTVVKDKKNAFKYLIKLIKLKHMINITVFKYFIFIALGSNTISNIRGNLRRSA